jgi:hypothetical protein
MRMMLPSFEGVDQVRCENALLHRFHRALIHGWTVNGGSGAATLCDLRQQHLIPVRLDADGSSRAVVALPVRTVVNSRFTASTALSINCFACLM